MIVCKNYLVNFQDTADIKLWMKQRIWIVILLFKTNIFEEEDFIEGWFCGLVLKHISH
jgi:hypothetical protein